MSLLTWSLLCVRSLICCHFRQEQYKYFSGMQIILQTCFMQSASQSMYFEYGWPPVVNTYIQYTDYTHSHCAECHGCSMTVCSYEKHCVVNPRLRLTVIFSEQISLYTSDELALEGTASNSSSSNPLSLEGNIKGVAACELEQLTRKSVDRRSRRHVMQLVRHGTTPLTSMLT